MTAALRNPPPPLFEAWADALLAALARRGIAHTERARSLLVSAIEAQTEDGPGGTPEQVLEWLGQFPLDDIAVLYATKYNARRLTFNRCIRLLADLHELWIDARQMAIAGSGG